MLTKFGISIYFPPLLVSRYSMLYSYNLVLYAQCVENLQTTPGLEVY